MVLPTAEASTENYLEKLARARDWSTSPLGHPSTWPNALRTTVRLMLDSKFPMFLAWGPQLGCLYNEAYLPFLEAKHPWALGSRFQDVWSETWTAIAPLVERALSGDPVYFEDLPLTIHRHGRQEQAWFTFSYSPVRDDEDNVAGMFCAVSETTDRVLAQRRQAFQLKLSDTIRGLSDPHKVMEAATRVLGEYFSAGRAGYAEIDQAGKTISVHRDWTNGSMESLAGESRPLESFGPELVESLRRGETLRIDDVESDERSLPYAAAFASVGVRSLAVAPLREAGRLTAVLHLHEGSPRHWTDEEVTLLEDVAQRTWEAVRRAHTEEALKDETRVLELLNQAGRIVASTLDLEALLQSITDTATQLSGAKFGAFFYNRTNEQGEAWVLYTLSGAPREAFENLGQPRPTPLFGPVFKGDAAIRSDDVLQDPRYGKLPPHHGMPPGHLPVRSYLAVPVISRSGESLGGLLFGHPDPGLFTERTERIISGVAAQAAVAIDNARLYELAQRAAEEREISLRRERAAREEAERLNKMKDEFLAMLAHELRNPLAPIATAASLLSLPQLDESRLRQAGNVIARQVAHMTRLVDDLLDVSRVTWGAITINKEVLDFRDVVRGALDQVGPLFAEKGHQVKVSMPDEAVYMEGDEVRLVQAVSNVLNNAGKYTPGGGKIDVSLVAIEDQLQLKIRDNGSGMPADLIQSAFDLFTQGARTLARSQGGLGLGLALVKKLVELHGGSVAAYSAGAGEGSEFTFRLPVAGAAAKATGLSQHDSDTSGSRKTRLMIVDDNLDAAQSLAMLMEARGYEVAVAYNGAEALQRLRAEPADTLLLDIGLPDMDGYELARRIRGVREVATAKLIALTGYGRAEDVERAKEAGFDHHMLKPVNTEKLLAVLGDSDNATG